MVKWWGRWKRIPFPQTRKPNHAPFKEKRRIPRTRDVHPKPMHIGYRLVGYGNEAAVYQIPGRGIVHKFWRMQWILAHYPMFDIRWRTRGRLFQQASARAAKWLDSQEGRSTFENPRFGGLGVDKVPIEKGAHGIPMEQFRRITFVLSHASRDILRRARNEGIPSPAIARVVMHPKKLLYVLELTDLSKKDHIIFSGNELEVRNRNSAIKNFEEIKRGIERDKRILRQMGLEEDLDTHTMNSAWLIRLNERTRIGERILWDVTNLKTSGQRKELMRE